MDKKKADGADIYVVLNYEDEPEAHENDVLAAAIVKIGEAVAALRGSGLNEKAVVVLLHDALKGKVGKPQIRLVLETLPRLREMYCNG